MEAQEFTGKTVDEAIQKALEKLGAKIEEVNITVLATGKPGFFGLGGEEARIRVTPKTPSIREKAKEVLENILSHMRMPATTHFTSPPEGLGPGPRPITINIRGEDMARLIGRRGQTLTAIQYLVNLIIAHQLKRKVNILIDVGGYRRRRHRALRNLALRLAEQVKATGQPITMEPMPAIERRVVHLALANDPDIVTRSIGEGENRKIVIERRSQTPGQE